MKMRRRYLHTTTQPTTQRFGLETRESSLSPTTSQKGQLVNTLPFFQLL